MDLSGGFDAYVSARLDAGVRIPVASATRKARKLERDHGPLRYSHHTTDAAAFETLMSWKSAQYERTGAANPLARQWIRDVLAAVSATETEGFGGLLSTLSVGDRLAAVHLGMRSSQVWHSWFPAYDPALASYSPGLLLLAPNGRERARAGPQRDRPRTGHSAVQADDDESRRAACRGERRHHRPRCACHSHPPHDEIARPAHCACAQGQAGAARNDRPPCPRRSLNRTRILNFHGVGPPPRGLEPGEERVWLTVDEVKRVLDLIAGQPKSRSRSTTETARTSNSCCPSSAGVASRRPSSWSRAGSATNISWAGTTCPR